MCTIIFLNILLFSFYMNNAFLLQTWIDLKSEVKGQAADINCLKVKTGNRVRIPQLTPIREKIRDMMNPVIITGDEQIMETGRTDKVQECLSKYFKYLIDSCCVYFVLLFKFKHLRFFFLNKV